jgi:hypothetical protein
MEWGIARKYNRDMIEAFLGTAFSVNIGNHEYY